MVNNPKIHERKIIRLKNFDYSTQGLYFITICTQNRECIYGDIEDGIFIPNQAGAMIEQYWSQIEQEFQNIKLDEFVIMPNHIHGIIYIGDCYVGTETRRADTRPAPTIGDVICAYKSKTTNCYIENVKQNHWEPFNKKLWQRSYYEHVIRNEDDLRETRYYIENNPLKWEFDKDNPSYKNR